MPNHFIKSSMIPPAEVLENLPKMLQRKRTSSNISLTVETIARDRGCSLLEACEHFLNEDGMTDQDFAGLLTPALRDKLEVEARDLNYLKEATQDESVDSWM